jgi:hypothetical protein
MKEITIAQFNKLKKRGPFSSQSLIPGKWYYIYDNRRVGNPVYIGKYVEPVRYLNENSVLYNYKFTNVSYLVKPSNIRNEPRGIFGNVEKYYEVIDEPTNLDIKHKKTTIKELKSFINEKKAEPHDSTPNISFFGKDYRKARNKFNNSSRSSLSSSLSRKHLTTSKSSSSSRRSSTPTKSSSSSRRSSTPRTSSSSRKYRTRRTYRTT